MHVCKRGIGLIKINVIRVVTLSSYEILSLLKGFIISSDFFGMSISNGLILSSPQIWDAHQECRYDCMTFFEVLGFCSGDKHRNW